MTDILNESFFGKSVNEQTDQELERRLIPKGGIPGLSPLLDARRLQFKIPNGAFGVQPAFNVCFVHQLPRYTKTYGDTSILMPDTAQRRVEEETPGGVLISAGMEALDCLRSNGIELGHVVSFIRLAPWRMPCDTVQGHDYHLVILRAGDITGSVDLRMALMKGKCRVEYKEDIGQHVFVDNEGKRWDPRMPTLSEDY